MTTEPVEQLSQAFAATEQVIATLKDDDWAKPTPCTEWNVRDLVSHLIAGNDRFTVILGVPDVARDGWSGDLLEGYRRSADSLIAAFGRPGVLEDVVTVPIGPVPGIAALHLRITEVLAHGWDLARATGTSGGFPEELAEQELVFSRAKLADIPSGRTPFGPPQPVAKGAPAIDRLAACLGRSVATEAPNLGGL